MALISALLQILGLLAAIGFAMNGYEWLKARLSKPKPVEEPIEEEEWKEVISGELFPANEVLDYLLLPDLGHQPPDTNVILETFPCLRFARKYDYNVQFTASECGWGPNQKRCFMVGLDGSEEYPFDEDTMNCPTENP